MTRSPRSAMKIGIYFKTEHLGEWNWEDVLEGRVGVSGTDYRNIDLAYQLSRHGVEVTVYATQTPLPPPPDGVKSISVASLPEVVERAGPKGDLLWFSNREDQDTWDGIQKCRELGVPCIVSSGIDLSLKTADLLHQTESVRRLVTVSAAQADLLRDHPVFAKTEAIHGNGLKPAFTKKLSDPPKRDTHRVGFLGSLTASKGFQHVARTWPAVKDTIPDATLDVVGSAKLYDRDESLGPLGVARASFERNHIIPHLGGDSDALERKGISFHGLLSPKEIRKVFERCSIGVVNPICSGSIETFCVSAVEVQACGAAVVSANRVGLKETARHGETGLLIESEEELAPTLIDLLKDPDRARMMGRRGREWVRSRFTRERVADEWMSLFESVCAGDSPSPPSFSWRRTTLRNTVREGIRRARSLPWIGSTIPSLRDLREKIGGAWR